MATSRKEKISHYIDTAEKVKDEFPEVTLNTLRKFFEAVILEISDRNGIKGNPNISKALENNYRFEKVTKYVPSREYYYISHIKNMGNYGSHFQEDGVDPSEQDISYCIYAAKEIYQWLFPENRDPKKINFINEIHMAVSCNLCESPIGVMCKKNSGEEVAKNCEHTIRKRAYSAYRRSIQKQYSTSINECFHQMVDDMKLSSDDIINHEDIKKWFKNNYPAYSESSIYKYAMIMATNLKSRLSYNMVSGNNYDLLFAVGNNFRKYNPDSDPTPLQ
tara:strand:+ start:170 stop:997 length:828 start_codon:yes stop_codon:yes gene_type:complete